MNPGIESLPLRDIHLPDGVAWWPPALGWWLLLALIMALAALVLIVRRINKSQQFSRLALAEFNALTANYNRHGDTQKLVEDLSALLRRITLSAFPDRNAAGITGEAWLRLLDEIAEQQTSVKLPAKFHSPLGQWMVRAPYQKRVGPGPQDAQQLLSLCRDWIQSAARQARPPLASGVR
ncbi:MAG TPA: DUF4381 domain-containing protein [Gammaproteobacteria bacterium]